MEIINKQSVLITVPIVLALFITGCLGKTEEPENSSEQPQQPVAPVVVEKEPEPEFPEEPELPGAVMVMFDNLEKARPQSGLDKADLVYEIVAESGITRYMALFYHQKAEKIGPIRSTRDYFVQLVKGYDLPLAHAGGSQAALALIPQIKMKDLDEIYNSGAYFWRDTTRKKPHNLYSSTDKLLEGTQKRGYKLVEPSFLQPVATAWDGGEPYTGDVEFNYSVGKYTYKATWHYNSEKKNYERSINGRPHLVADGTKITANNVIIMLTQIKTYIKDGISLSDVKVIGKGEALYYINGVKIKGYWQKDSANAPLKFYRENGALMELKKGNTWIQVIPGLKYCREIPEVSSDTQNS